MNKDILKCLRDDFHFFVLGSVVRYEIAEMVDLSTVTLLILILPSMLDWCTHRILQIMQLLPD